MCCFCREGLLVGQHIPAFLGEDGVHRNPAENNQCFKKSNCHTDFSLHRELAMSLISSRVYTGMVCRAWTRRSCMARTTPARGTSCSGWCGQRPGTCCACRAAALMPPTACSAASGRPGTASPPAPPTSRSSSRSSSSRTPGQRTALPTGQYEAMSGIL